MSGWCLIESDPGVFTELVESLGVEGVEFEEVYSLESVDSLLDESVLPVEGSVSATSEKRYSASTTELYGLVFLFKWTDHDNSSSSSSSSSSASSSCTSLVSDAATHRRDAATDTTPLLGNVISYTEQPALFFAKQVIPNACATQAILSILLNTLPQLRLGPHLSELQSFSTLFDPHMKGLAISNSDQLRLAHNSFKAQTSFDMDEDDREGEKKRRGEDSFHFISYVCFAGSCYELDGLSDGPRWLGEVSSGQRWTSYAVSAIRTRIQRLQEGRAGSEIRFSLMACVESKLKLVEASILQQRATLDQASAKLLSVSEMEQSSAATDSLQPQSRTDVAATTRLRCDEMEFLPDDEPTLKDIVDSANRNLQLLNESKVTELAKRERWRRENNRRRHNLAPLVFCALRQLARRRELRTAYKEAIPNQPAASS